MLFMVVVPHDEEYEKNTRSDGKMWSFKKVDCRALGAKNIEDWACEDMKQKLRFYNQADIS